VRTNEPEPGRERENLMVQLQSWPGERMHKECLRPPAAPLDTVAYGYLGDMQLRFVFDEPGLARSAAVRPADLARLGLTPPQAVARAVANCKRFCGPPQVTSLADGVYTLRGAHLEYNATYLLDRGFWRGQLEKFPQGLLAALPRKGVLLFAAAGNAGVEAELGRQAARILASADSAAISSWVYRFDASGWQPQAGLPRPEPKAARAPASDFGDEPAAESDHDGVVDLEKAARGQRMLVFSILGGFMLNGYERVTTPNVYVFIALTLFITIYSLVGVVRLSSGLGRSTGAKIVFMVLTFVPLANLVSWIVLSVQATRALRAAGWSVGLLGAKELG
jgi:hypothetical protein